MKLKSGHILAALSAALLIFSSCLKKEEEKVIPRSKLARIYAEMLLTDQWIQDTPAVKSVADTSLIYEPILEKYGYTKMDYLHTVDEYLDDPERFSRIWREASEILDERLKEAKKRREAMESAEDKVRERQKYAVDFNLEENFPYMFKEPYIHFHDSLAFEVDSALRAYRFFEVVTADTTYEGVVMNVRADTLAVSVSLMAADTLAVTDSSVSVVSELKSDTVKVRTPAKTIRRLNDEGNLPLRQVRRPEYSKDMKDTDELKVIDHVN